MSNSDVYNNGMSYYQKMGRIYRRIVVPKSVRNAAKIIAVSAYTKRDIVRYFPWYRDGDVVVVHSGVGSIDGVGDCGDDMLKTQNTYGIKGNYIIALGGQDPRKNTRMIIEAFRFIKQNANISCKLVIVGMSSWKKGVYNQMAKEVFCGNDIIFTGFVGDRDLINLYKNALLFIYPSLYEGFGHPPLEAMACGVPVIASNVSSIPEIVGNAAYLVNPYNINEIIGAILQLLHDGDMRAELIRRGYEKVSEYSWDRTVRNTVGVYESIEIVK
jgi:glycosyltransferase involved in cell wall biosynthesis